MQAEDGVFVQVGAQAQVGVFAVGAGYPEFAAVGFAGEVAAGTADGVKVSADRFSKQALLAESASPELLGALALTVALPAKSQAWALYFEKT